MAGLYVHIPFCVRKCDYCAFYSEVAPDRARQVAFFDALEREVQSLPSDFHPTTIFIGGGTPTAPALEILERYLPRFARFAPAEFSVEVNPGTVDAATLTLLRRCGVNRLSMGVQSFDARSLAALGRIHSGRQAREAFGLARELGFENLSLDLMFGTPGQSLARLEDDLESALALGPDHLSIYNLMLEEGTPLAARNPPRPDEALEREMYDLIRARLTRAGLKQYEISNFSKPGFECRHNLLYWTGGEYLGCGPAAHSHWNGVRWGHASDLDDYCARGPCREFEECLEPDAKARETLVMGLRLLRGVEVSERMWAQQRVCLEQLRAAGLVRIAGRRVRLAEEALFVSDAVFAELV